MATKIKPIFSLKNYLLKKAQKRLAKATLRTQKRELKAAMKLGKKQHEHEHTHDHDHDHEHEHEHTEAEKQESE